MAKILYVWQGGFPWEVRVEKVCLALRREGHEVTVLARGKAGQPQEDEFRGLRVVRVGGGLPGPCSAPISANPLWKSAIRREVATWRPDLVMPREIMLAEAAARACRRRGIPVVIDMAEHYPATMRALKKYQRNAVSRFIVSRARIPDRVERNSVGLADGVITVCEEQNRRLQDTYGYPHGRMAVVHNTPELEVFARARVGSSAPPRVFAYHGSMSAQRGLDALIRGFAAVAAVDPTVRLDLAGGGESHAELVRLAHDVEVADRVRFTGPYRFGELADLYGESDVGMVTYPTEESVEHTIGNKLFDYMACGKPVIVSPAGPLRRVVEETRAGIVLEGFSPEAIARGMKQMLAADPGPFSENGLAASRERYNWGHDAGVMNRFLKGYL
jgi:glycosyltransferase involved in cell wall biosynthesis